MGTDRVEGLERDLAALREEVVGLRRAIAEVENRLNRLEVREEILESPEAAGDEPVRHG
jgi:prefoldin subunit 5